jgi:hypothetical protein
MNQRRLSKSKQIRMLHRKELNDMRHNGHEMPLSKLLGVDVVSRG